MRSSGPVIASKPVAKTMHVERVLARRWCGGRSAVISSIGVALHVDQRDVVAVVGLEVAVSTQRPLGADG